MSGRGTAAASAVNGDPGLQPQRTALAWNRTALAVFVNALLVLRAGAHGGQGAHGAQMALLAAGGLLLVGAGGMMACGALRRRQLLLGRPPVAPSSRLMGVALAVALFACLSGAGAIWLERGGLF